MTSSFYWHDYETFGIDPQKDRASQFAGIRTDAEFNIIDKPLVLYCRLPEDCLPSPEACLITGITPQRVAHGLNEAEFIARIHQEMSQPQTCCVGYNSIRFDDEVTRNLLYRNFYDPYAREWQHQNSRWDLIDVVRACHALRPDGIIWPQSDEGVVSLKLEALSKANNILHEQAHDALSDVYATIAMAKLIKQLQPKLLEYTLNLRNKQFVQALLTIGQYKPLVHISGRYPNKSNNLAIVLPVCVHPFNDKEICVYDLSISPAEFIDRSVDELRDCLFSSYENSQQESVRLPVKTIHINKCPVVAPLNVMRNEDWLRLKLDPDSHQKHIEIIKNNPEFSRKIQQIYSKRYETTISDPELMIYSGGFFSRRDKQTMDQLRTLTPDMFNSANPIFSDDRLSKLWFRYKARNWPDTLNDHEKASWRSFCQERLHQGQPSAWQSFVESIQKMQSTCNQDDLILKDLLEYAQSCRPEKYQS